MSQSNHQGTGQLEQNQNNAMSDDPGDGGRKSFTTGRDGKKTAVEESPEEQSQTEAFEEEGAGIAPKE
jgi:hypothetical protein